MDQANVRAPKAHVIRESKALAFLGFLIGVFVVGLGYVAVTQNFTMATRALVGSCMVLLIVCAGFFLALYFNYRVRIEPEFAEHRSASRKVVRIAFADVTSFAETRLGKTPVLRLVGPNREVINIPARKYETGQIIAVLTQD